MLRFILGALLCCLGLRPAWAAEPPSVAVLPLQKGAGSAQYDGLGRALAGMLVSDLSTVPALRLVERDQLDALLAEIKLGDGAYLDPRTAQKLGKGVGARFVVTGSFTVLDPSFALDARIVAVETGEIVKAADAHGTVEDFVAVEKELVEALVAGLDLTLSSADRRKLLMSAPTERFSAFSAWAEALARRDEGQFDAAQAALNRALAEDPAFADAQAALGDLQLLVRRQEAARTDAKQSVRDAAYAAFLATVPDDRQRPADFVYDQQALAHWALRISVLEQQGRECDRYGEMRHYLERVGWKIAEPPRKPTDEGVYGYAVGQLAKASGLDQRADDLKLPEYLRDWLPGRVMNLFRNTPTYVLDGASQYKRAHGLISSLLACHGGKEALTEIDGLLASARAAGAGATRVDRSALTLEEHLQLWWTRTRAVRYGADAELSRRTQALLAAHRGDEEAERQALALVEEVLGLAKSWEDHQVRRRGLPPQEVYRRMKLIADGKFPDDPVCKQLGNWRGSAAHWVTEYDRLEAESANFLPTHVDQGFATWGPAADFGCLQGVPARFKTPEAAFSWYESARKRAISDAPSTCVSSWTSYEQILEQSKPTRNDPGPGPTWLMALDQTLAGLVYGRCVTE